MRDVIPRAGSSAGQAIRRTLIAAGIYAALPAAVAAGCLALRALASIGLLPEMVPALAVLAILLAALACFLYPFGTPRILPGRYFDRFQVSAAERKAGLFALAGALVVIAVLYRLVAAI